MSDYSVQAFPQETRDDIAKQFHAYFRRKKKSRLSYREAKQLIDYASGPAPGPRGADAVDLTQPRVSGGGAARPTSEAIDNIYRRHGADDEPNEWDAVFDELMRRCAYNRDAEEMIFMLFRDNYSYYVVCSELGISKSRLYELRRGILEQAGVIAVKKEVLDPWKY